MKSSIVSVGHEILTPDEAADFLRFSRSTIYQRRDIPRHRLPGSRQIRFIRSELLAWMKGEPHCGGEGPTGESDSTQPETTIDIASGRVYHRNTRYR